MSTVRLQESECDNQTAKIRPRGRLILWQAIRVCLRNMRASSKKASKQVHQAQQTQQAQQAQPASAMAPWLRALLIPRLPAKGT